MRNIILVLLLSGCTTTMPTKYGQDVYVSGEPYKGHHGKLIEDCSWFENYLVRLNGGKAVCVRGWHLEGR